VRCDASTKTRGAKAPQKKGVLKCFRQASVDFKGLGKVDIRYNCVHGLYVCRALEHHPRIAPIRNHHLPAHRSDVFLLLAETKTAHSNIRLSTGLTGVLAKRNVQVRLPNSQWVFTPCEAGSNPTA